MLTKKQKGICRVCKGTINNCTVSDISIFFPSIHLQEVQGLHPVCLHLMMVSVCSHKIYYFCQGFASARNALPSRNESIINSLVDVVNRLLRPKNSPCRSAVLKNHAPVIGEGYRYTFLEINRGPWRRPRLSCYV